MTKQLMLIPLLLLTACDKMPPRVTIPEEIQDCACDYYREHGDEKLIKAYCALRGAE